MFEAAEVGHSVSRTAFRRAAGRLRTQLLEVQTRLADAQFPVIVVIAGDEGAGTGGFVSRLTDWLDPRRLQTSAYWSESDAELQRPAHWRYWRDLPPHGTIGLLFGAWYLPPIEAAMHHRSNKAQLDSEMVRIQQLERMLHDDGAVIIKLWFHIDREEQKKRLRQSRRQWHGRTAPPRAAHGKRFRRIVESVIRATDAGHAPWQIIDAHDHHYRDLAAGRILLDTVNARLQRPDRRRASNRVPPPPLGPARSVLDHLDLDARLPERSYQKQLAELQARLGELAWKGLRQGSSTVVVFEGWDAAGKGGVIRRIAASVDARLYRVIPIGAPTDEEQMHHYLWRFWRHLPPAGNFTIYDRSWYGRVLVERVEGLASSAEWGRAYAEINDFEQQLAGRGIVVCKFWMHISPQEQLRRFRERERIPYKRYKMSADDWRNRSLRKQYITAVDEMVARTSTEHAPWTLVPADCKRFGRIEVLKTLVERLEEQLK
jgi:polyphosphate:AMP phosphotransferase